MPRCCIRFRCIGCRIVAPDATPQTGCRVASAPQRVAALAVRVDLPLIHLDHSGGWNIAGYQFRRRLRPPVRAATTRPLGARRLRPTPASARTTRTRRCAAHWDRPSRRHRPQTPAGEQVLHEDDPLACACSQTRLRDRQANATVWRPAPAGRARRRARQFPLRRSAERRAPRRWASSGRPPPLAGAATESAAEPPGEVAVGGESEHLCDLAERAVLPAYQPRGEVAAGGVDE